MTEEVVEDLDSSANKEKNTIHNESADQLQIFLHLSSKVVEDLEHLQKRIEELIGQFADTKEIR